MYHLEGEVCVTSDRNRIACLHKAVALEDRRNA